MKVPLSWVRDFVDIDVPILELAHRLTLAGLEVTGIRSVGLEFPTRVSENEDAGHGAQAMVTGLAWAKDKIVVGEIREVGPHPNADRLVLCRLFDGRGEQTVLTGAPNLFPLKSQGPLSQPLKVAYAREGSEIYDGHEPGWIVTTLKRAKIRGVESSSMVCSEKELGISEDHEGIIVLDDDAPVGEPLAEYMGDIVFDIDLTPNIARDSNILGVAREISALYELPLRSRAGRSIGPAIPSRGG
jgi:phenylalanyl-tRNA synthetase beta chain